MDILSAPEVARRIAMVMEVLSEEKGGRRVIEGDNVVKTKLIHMASCRNKRYCHALEVVDAVYKKRRNDPGPDDLYVQVLNAVCDGDSRTGAVEDDDVEIIENPSLSSASTTSSAPPVSPASPPVSPASPPVSPASPPVSPASPPVSPASKSSSASTVSPASKSSSASTVSPASKSSSASTMSPASKSSKVFQETLMTLRKMKGPLSLSHMPRSSLDVNDVSYEVESIHPWTLKDWESDNLVEFNLESLPRSVAVGRRDTVLHAYRSGKMYAVLDDGRVGMSPPDVIQSYVDRWTKDRGSKMTLSEWMVFLKQTIVTKEKSIAKLAKKRKHKSHAASTVKVAHAGCDPFNIGNMSSDEDD